MQMMPLYQNLQKEVLQSEASPVQFRLLHFFHAEPEKPHLFLSLYKLLIKEEKKIEDYDLVYDKLLNISSRTMNIAGGGGWWASKEKNELIQATSSVLESCLVDRCTDDPMYYSYTTELETLLKQSKTENSQYDFKQGLYDLRKGVLNDGLISKVFKTLTAMANTDNKAVGYVIIGVADKFEDAEKIKDK